MAGDAAPGEWLRCGLSGGAPRRKKGEIRFSEEELLRGGMSGYVEEYLIDGLEDGVVTRRAVVVLSGGTLPVQGAKEKFDAAGLVSAEGEDGGCDGHEFSDLMRVAIFSVRVNGTKDVVSCGKIIGSSTHYRGHRERRGKEE